MNIRNLVVRKTYTPSCKEGLTPSFSQGLGCLLSQKNSSFNQVFKTRLYLNLRSYIVCQKIKGEKKDKKMALLTTWWWQPQNKFWDQKSKYMTFFWRKLASWWNIKWFACTIRDKGKLPSVHRPLTTKECFSESKGLCYKVSTKRAGKQPSWQCFPSVCKALRSVPSTVKHTNLKKPKGWKLRKVKGKGEDNRSFMQKGLVVSQTHGRLS